MQYNMWYRFQDQNTYMPKWKQLPRRRHGNKSMFYSDLSYVELIKKYFVHNFKFNLLASWEYWSDWGSCTAGCGKRGNKTRTRQCLNGNASDNGCQGFPYEQRQCSSPPCGKDSKYVFNFSHKWTMGDNI